MNQLKRIVDTLLAYAIICISSLLVLCVVWQVTSRYVLGTPSVFTDEVARFMFMWVGLVGAAYATSQKRHLAIDLLVMKLTGNARKYLEIVILLATITFVSLVMIYGGMNLVTKTLASGQISPVLGIPMGLVYVAIPVSGGAILFYSIIDLIEKFTNRSSSDNRVQQ